MAPEERRAPAARPRVLHAAAGCQFVSIRVSSVPRSPAPALRARVRATVAARLAPRTERIPDSVLVIHSVAASGLHAAHTRALRTSAGA